MRRSIATSVLLAAIVAAALLGSSSASASVLCKANEAPCSPANAVKNGSSLGFSGQISFGTKYVCKAGATVGPVTDMGDEGKAARSQLSFALFTCELQGSPGASCLLSFPGMPYDLEFEGSGGNGTVKLSDPTELTFKVECTSPVQVCTFSTKEAVSYGFTGGNPAVMSVANVPVGSGAGCPTTMSMELKSSSPTSLYIVGGLAPLTRLCAVNSSPCPEPDRYAIGSSLEGALEGDSTFEFLY